MAESIGWISLHRQIRENWIWQDPIKFKWWIDILLTVNIEPTIVNLGYQNFPCARGETLLSLQSWATKWKVSKDTARNFLKLLEKENMIVCVSVGKSTRLTVCKYEDYQTKVHVKQTASKRIPNAPPTQYNNDNKEDNDNKEYVYGLDNVLLSKKELKKLIDDFGENGTSWMCQKLNSYKNSKGKTYKSDYSAILNWVVDEYKKIHNPLDKIEYTEPVSMNNRIPIMGK